MPATAGRSSCRPVTRRRSSPRIGRACSARTPTSGPGSPASGCAGSARWRSSPGPRSSPGSGRRARGSTPGRAARRPIRSARAGPRSGWPCTSRSSRRRRSSSRSASSSTGWPARSPISCWRAAWPRPGRTCDWSWTSRSPGPGRAPEVAVEQRFPEPTADAEAIERLLFARLERTRRWPRWRAWTWSSPARSRPSVSSSRCSCRRPPATRGSAGSLARLALTFGEDRVRRVALLDPEAPLPEARWTWRGRSELGRPGDRGAAMTRLLREHPAHRGRDRRDRPARRDRLERPTRAGRGLQSLAGGGGLVARADRPRLRQGRRSALARARLPRPGRRHVAPRTPLRLTRQRGRTLVALGPAARRSASRPIRPRCVSWNEVGSFRPYPASRSMPLWATRIAPTATTGTDPSARPRPATTTPVEQVVDDVVDDGPDPRAAQVADRRHVRHEQQQREGVPRHAQPEEAGEAGREGRRPSRRSHGRIQRVASTGSVAAVGRSVIVVDSTVISVFSIRLPGIVRRPASWLHSIAFMANVNRL